MPVELSIPLLHQFALLLMIALPVACAAWTVTHEEVFREPREFCKRMSQDCKALPQRKFFYLFTCEYCFSHYVAALALFLFRFQMLYAGCRGLDRERVHERVQPAALGHQARKRRDRRGAGRDAGCHK
jgi:hypothetical protein